MGWLKDNAGGLIGGALGFVGSGFNPAGAMAGYGIGQSLFGPSAPQNQQTPDFQTNMNPMIQGMQDQVGSMNRVGGASEDLAALQLGKGKSMMDYWGSQNVMQRQGLKSGAVDATQTGAMNQQRMAAQQGMGGSGLMTQALGNQAYKNMMGAADMGNTAYQKSFGLGRDFLRDSASTLAGAGSTYGAGATALGGAGKMQSEVDVSGANWQRQQQEQQQNTLGNIASTGMEWYMKSQYPGTT